MSACPPDETWAAFPKAVSAAERESLVLHLAACSSCRGLVAELARQGAITSMPSMSPDDASDPTISADDPPRAHTIATRLGRFIVLDVLGEGGMGTVLSAYDPRLERRVALKVLRGATARSVAGHARLLREAQALARIAHPHVVPIHEVAELDGEVVLVMEHVSGQTLQDWARAETRSWRENVRAYLQAGRGLAAAHAAGLVHRDFKPSNALIGADGRVRVIDFGLVREAESGAEEAALTPIDEGTDSTQDAARLTRTGTVLGTPAYMAPEQFERADVGPRTDVYAFCISLTEALYGVRPFGEGRRGFGTGEGSEPPSPAAVPRRVWAVLRRGLSAAPDDRPQSIDELLDALGALVEPARRRRIVAAMTAVGVAGAAIAAVALTRTDTQEEPCSGGAAQIAPIWNDAVADDVKRQLVATGAAYGEAVTPRLVGSLTTYAREWTGAHRAACMAHRRGEQSAALLDRRMHCLDRQRQALEAAIDVLVHDDEVPGDPVRLVMGLPPVSRCADLDVLSASMSQSSDPVSRTRSRALEGQLERAAALERHGDYRRAGEIAARVVRSAAPLASARLDASANLQLGRARLLAGKLSEAGQPLRVALRHAIIADAPEIAVEAIARRIYVEGVSGALERGTLVELRSLAEDFLERTPDGAFERALLLNNVGVIYRSFGDRDTARETLRQALAARDAVERPEMELSVIVENLAAVTDDPAERQELFERAAHEAEASLGAQHPETLRSRLVQSAGTAAPDERRGRLREVCAAWERFHPHMTVDRAMCEQMLAAAEQELGDRDAASVRYARVASLYTTAGQTLRADLARGHAEQLAGRYAPARAALGAALEQIDSTTSRPWELAQRAEIAAATAEIAAHTGQHREAVHRADEAITTLDRIDVRTQLQWQVIAARARVTSARSRLALGGRARREQAAVLLEAAQRWYRSVATGYESRLREIDRLLATARER